MDAGIIGAFLGLVLILFLAGGFWVALSLFGVGILGIAAFSSAPAGSIMATTSWGQSWSWSLTALPLFIWMGEILFRTRLAEDMFKGLSPWMTRIPGRLMHVNVIGCGIFAAVSGSSAATTATIGRITIPELAKRGYDDRMSLGTLAGSATLGLLIPPSIIMIVYGVTVNESIAQLFMAGILPGIMLAGLFMGYIAIRALMQPETMPDQGEPMNFAGKIRRSVYLLPVVGLIMVVLGSIYFGIATATEAAVLGVVGALVLSLLQGSLNWQNFTESLLSATRTSCMIALILAGAHFLTLAMGFTGLPRHLAEFIGSLQLSPLMLIAALTVFYIVLGCFLDGISSVVLTMAVVEPMIRQAGIDLVWFGIFLVIVVEMAQITPPVGFNLFVLQGMTNHDMGYIARAAVPMFLVMVLAVAIIVAFPEIVMYLPETMRKGPAG